MSILGKILLLLVILLVGPVLALAGSTARLGQDWRTADRSSAGIAPAPADTPEAIVSVWAARAFNWRGLLAVHTWIATKPENASRYTVHQVVGWRGRGGGNVVLSTPDLPDRAWYGQPPRLVKELRGPAAARAIPKILEAVSAYPYTHQYRLWPGPNSNTFTAFVARRVPELGVELPAIAIGKDYLDSGRFFDAAPGEEGIPDLPVRRCRRARRCGGGNRAQHPRPGLRHRPARPGNQAPGHRTHRVRRPEGMNGGPCASPTSFPRELSTVRGHDPAFAKGSGNFVVTHHVAFSPRGARDLANCLSTSLREVHTRGNDRPHGADRNATHRHSRPSSARTRSNPDSVRTTTLTLDR